MAIDLSGLSLLVRPRDHVIVGVQWWGLEPALGGDLRAGADAGLVITLPPQHLAEGTGVPSPGVLTSADLSGPSRVVLRIPPDTHVAPTVDGLLALLGGATVPPPATVDGAGTAIELPYGLRFAPQAVTGDVHCAAPREVAVSPTGTAGLWRSRLHAAGLALAHLEALPKSFDPPELPLGAVERAAIADASRLSGSPAQAERLDLTCLGGALTARGDWPDLDWTHDAALGRDQRIRLTISGTLFPFGHRALYVESTDRVVTAGDTGAIAPLITTRTLIVTEPHRDLVVANDSRLDRQFPFDGAEITTTVFDGLAAPVEHPYTRESFQLADLERQRDDAKAAITTLMVTVQPFLDAPRTLDELGSGNAARYRTLLGEIGEREAQIAGLDEAARQVSELAEKLRLNAERVDQITSSNPQLPEGGFDPAVEAELRALAEEAAQLSAELRALGNPGGEIARLQGEIAPREAERQQLQPAIDAELAVPRTIEEVAASVPEAGQVLELRQQIAGFEASIARIAAENNTPRPWIYLPQTAPGRPLQFPVRCSTPGRPDVDLTLAMVFVANQVLPADDLFVAFDSHADKLDVVAAQYAAVSQVAVPGAPIDLVRDPDDGRNARARPPADVFEVHGLALAGVAHAGRFVPQITELQVALPALRALLGDAAHGAVKTVRLSEQLLSEGPSAEVVLDLVDDLDIDFRQRADVSGGLVAPKVVADVISRFDGPVAAAGLVAAGEHLDPLAVLDVGASLLGFDLRQLITALDAPPSIVHAMNAGQPPTVTMTWTDVKLKDVGPFIARNGADEAELDLTVATSIDGATTDCAVSNFALELPPGAGQVLILKFGGVRYLQELGREADLEISGIDAEFAGDLKLLDDLRALIDLGSRAPGISVSPAGISARYRLELPSGGAGVFQLRNIAVNIGLEVPFVQDLDEAITISLGFASRKHPFNLSVLLFGGGGYVEIVLDRDGLRRFELSFEFGAATSISFVIATAEVHALGGVRAIVAADEVTIAGFLRFGGAVELLGLISVSVELLIELRYEQAGNRLFGRATLVIEVDLTLYSDSIELDSGEWELIGSDDTDEAAEELDQFAEWQRYRAAFAEDEEDGDE